MVRNQNLIIEAFLKPSPHRQKSSLFFDLLASLQAYGDELLFIGKKKLYIVPTVVDTTNTVIRIKIEQTC